MPGTATIFVGCALAATGQQPATAADGQPPVTASKLGTAPARTVALPSCAFATATADRTTPQDYPQDERLAITSGRGGEVDLADWAEGSAMLVEAAAAPAAEHADGIDRRDRIGHIA